MTTFTTTPLSENFGVEIQSIDVSNPTFSNEDMKALLNVLYENRVIVLKNQELSEEDFIAFAKRVGTPIPHVLEHRRLPGYPEIYPITNITKDGEKPEYGAAHWHTDQSYEQEPSSVTMLYSLQAPETGGETQFCDLMSAYEALPQSIQDKIDNLEVEHLYGTGIAARDGDLPPTPLKGQEQHDAVPATLHPLVRNHPVTGKKTLYSIAGTSQGIKGMKKKDAQNLLRELGDHAFKDPFISKHHHRVHDLVLWDNPTTMHAATPISTATGPRDTRLIHRISVRGIPSVFEN